MRAPNLCTPEQSKDFVRNEQFTLGLKRRKCCDCVCLADHGTTRKARVHEEECAHQDTR